jgi:hypothetical protein
LDFWDITKVLGRHWRIALPMFLLTVVLTTLTAVQVKPGYVATAYVQLVPPKPIVVPLGAPEPEQRNPWLKQGLTTLGNAVIVTVLDLSYVHQLEAQGLAGKYTVVMDGATPQITFTVTGKTREQAVTTANTLVERYDQRIVGMQTSIGVAPVDLITGTRLDSGTNVTLSHSTLKRALVVVIGLGLVLTASIAVGYDIWLRRRARDSDGSQAVPDDPGRPGTALEVDGFPGARVLDGTSAGPMPESASRAQTQEIERASATRTAGAKPRSDDAARVSRTDAANASVDGRYDRPADATVVMPKAALARDQ